MGSRAEGFGASSSPAIGYSVAREGEDILAVLNALHIARPVLVGHSFAGQEVSLLAARFPDRIAGAVYLDAAYGYAFYDPSVGEMTFDLPALQKKLGQLNGSQSDLKLIDELLQTDLPTFERDLRQKKNDIEFMSLISQLPSDRARSTSADLASFKAFGAWYALNMVGGTPPEAELRQSFESNPDGSVGRPRSHPTVSAEDANWEKFTNIQVPILAIFACPLDYGPLIDSDPALREKVEAYHTPDCQARAKALKKDVPSARVLLWPRVYHYLFIAKQADTLREMRTFIDSLPH